MIHAGSALHVGSTKAERVWRVLRNDRSKVKSREHRVQMGMEIGFWKENMLWILQSRFLADKSSLLLAEEGRTGVVIKSSYVIHFQVLFCKR